jgi:hypothetical protein
MYKNIVLPTITIITLVMFYFVGASIGQDSFRFLTSAIGLTCFTAISAFKSSFNKSKCSTHSIAVQNTIGNK